MKPYIKIIPGPSDGAPSHTKGTKAVLVNESGEHPLPGVFGITIRAWVDEPWTAELYLHIAPPAELAAQIFGARASDGSPVDVTVLEDLARRYRLAA